MTTPIETTKLDDSLTRIDNAWVCEQCEGIFVGEHFSTPDCNTTGVGVTLCRTCCETTESEAAKAQPLQPIETDETGVLRFRPNSIIRWAVDTGRMNLNEIACLPSIPNADRCQLAQLIGYSLGGFNDLSYVSDQEWARVQTAKEANTP
jgi:hypothetical protein